jgi:hypothetical protein
VFKSKFDHPLQSRAIMCNHVQSCAIIRFVTCKMKLCIVYFNRDQSIDRRSHKEEGSALWVSLWLDNHSLKSSARSKGSETRVRCGMWKGCGNTERGMSLLSSRVSGESTLDESIDANYPL